MAINTKYLDKYIEAYEGLKTVTNPFVFQQTSPYYYEEIWKYVDPKYVPGVILYRYMVSNYGRVVTWYFRNIKLETPKEIKHCLNEHGYHQVYLTSTILKENGKHEQICIKVARLMMLTFCFMEDCQYFEVDHCDGNKDNNTLWNLEWVTPQENIYRAINNELRPASISSSSNNILSDEQARKLYELAISGIPYINLSKDFGVSIDYIKGLVSGSIRPYISKKTNYKSFHYEK